MKTKTKIIAGLGGSLFLGMMWSLVKPSRKIVPTLKIRVDTKGNGNYSASRSGGNREHKGIDLVVKPGEKVYSPFSGTLIRLENAYVANGLTFQGVKIFTDDDKLEVDVLYIIPTVATNDKVSKGQLIGYAQDVSAAYGSAMIPHIHVEHKDRLSNQFIDPTNYYFPNNAARYASIEENNENPSFT